MTPVLLLYVLGLETGIQRGVKKKVYLAVTIGTTTNQVVSPSVFPFAPFRENSLVLACRVTARGPAPKFPVVVYSLFGIVWYLASFLGLTDSSVVIRLLL